jgi:hypothetical protein
MCLLCLPLRDHEISLSKVLMLLLYTHAPNALQAYNTI